MCLTRAYLRRREEGDLLGEEVTGITRKGDALIIRDLMGESREVKKGFIREINFINNYVILDCE